MSSLGGGPPLDEGDLPAVTPEPVDVPDRSRVGTDEWVSQAEARRTAQTGLSGVVARTSAEFSRRTSAEGSCDTVTTRA